MKIAMPLAKNVLMPLGVTAAASAMDAGIQKKIRGFGNSVTLVMSNQELNDILQVIKGLEHQRMLVKGLSEAVEDEAKEQKGGFLSMLLGTLGASLLGNLMSSGNGYQRAGASYQRAGEGYQRAGEGYKRAGEGYQRAGF